MEAGLHSPQSPPPARPNTTCHFAVFDSTDVPATSSPLVAEMWEALLCDYPDRSFVDNIVGMIRHGAKLGYEGVWREENRPAVGVQNLPMSEEELHHIRQSVAERLAQRRSMAVNDGEVVVSPVGTVPKPNGKYRTINHLSWPRRRRGHPFVNDGIDPETVSFAYANLDNLFAAIRRASGEIWKVDLVDAYFHVVVASQDARLLGFNIDGVSYKDCTLNFGGRSSPFIFNLFAEALHWILRCFGLELDHYLDDSYGLAQADRGQATVRFFKAVCECLGIQVSEKKSGWGKKLEVLGIMVDAEEAKAWISEERKRKLLTQIDTILQNQSVNALALHSLAGSLNFVSRVCPTGRAFMSRIYAAVHKAVTNWQTVRVGRGLRDELEWWSGVLEKWDGVTLLYRDQRRVEVWTDAATTKGVGGHLGPREACTRAFSMTVRKKHSLKPILFLETLAVVEAIKMWSEELENKEVVFKVDNMALFYGLRSGKCDHKPTQSLLRWIFARALELHMTIVPDWVPSKVNDVADALSRFDWPYLLHNRKHVQPVTTVLGDISPPIPPSRTPHGTILPDHDWVPPLAPHIHVSDAVE